jgi:hypothetical protein
MSARPSGSTTACIARAAKPRTLRQNAEDVLIETGDLKVPDWEEIFAEEGSKHE